jgi:hypothetical protein
MKLTLWQQFASNHSNSFTLVGVFPTPEDARLAADMLREFLSQYMAWVKAHPDAAEEYYKSRYDELPELENEFYRQEGVSLRGGILEWIYALNGYVVLNDALYAYGNLLLMDSHTEAAQGGKPFDDLIIRWSGTAFVQRETGADSLYYHLEIDAPDEAAALEIEQILRKNFRGSDELAPWVRFDSGEEVEVTAWERLLPLLRQWQDWKNKLPRIYKTPNKIHREKRFAAHQAANPLRHLSDAEQQRIHRMGDLSAMIRWNRYGESTLTRDGKHLSLVLYHFYETSHVRGLPALLAWLKSLGCDVKVDFEVRE